MTGRQPGRRPRSVTVLVVLTVLAALMDLGVAALLFLAAAGGDAQSSETSQAGVVVAGVLFAVIGLVVLLLAVGLARGNNAARLLVTLMTVSRFAMAWYLLARLQPNELAQGLVGLLMAALSLWLLWNAKATAWFEQPRERGLVRSLTGGRSRSWTERFGSWVPDYLLRLAVLGVTIALTPGITVSSSGSLLLAVALISLAGWTLRPLMVRTASLFGWVGAVMLALFANAAVIGLGLAITPGVVVASIPSAILASWVYALAMTVITWGFSAGSGDYLVVHAARMSMRGREVPRSEVPGVLFVQLDGLPAPVLEYELRAGNLPTLSRWMRTGSHTWTEWVARVPSTTPVSQAGLLHGTNDGIPAFRWYERDSGRLVVANRPEDAALIESRISSGRGLLADDGVSISNLFSGDAATSLLTMSGLRNPRQGLGPSRSYAAFFTHPAGFLRALLLTVGEMGKEVFQARRQERRGVQPRVHRSGSYVALRAVTNVFLRDLNVALIVEAMMSGAKSIYVDFVDYDELAHHAGITRPESLASIYGLDSMLGSLERLAASGTTPRPYRIVLVSDHGQSQGATFRQRYGSTLEELVSSLMSDESAASASTDDVEAWGPVNTLLDQLSEQGSLSGRLASRARSGDAAATATALHDGPPLVVIGSGNLGGIWFAQHPYRLQLADIEALHPGLVSELAGHPGIGFLVAMTERGPLAVGPAGTHDLTTGRVTGTDPLTGFGADARADFLRAASFEHAPDIYVNSVYDPVLDEVAAFEELVGCHGGLGGWQTRPVLVHPSDWTVDADLLDDRDRLYGADVVHCQLVRWLERCGHRDNLSRYSGEPMVETG